ncbi:DUF456 domain-containing protein [Fredinandcohnia sp. 179-A 10B2 NHS]|uniref:DUF456 domain-containing protein n=1 Tax=Fredinandcohnia sp. 179-A 10B2 NHS TaxID=3235176 RepID=UPI00399F514E
MDIIMWLLVVLLFLISFIGLVYPIIPSVLFIVGGFIVFGLFQGFESFSVLFWVIEGLFFVLLMGADYATNLIGVKKYGGSKAAIWGSTIGLLIGPFVIPIAGIIIGPFIGAFLAELLIHKKTAKDAFKSGFGSVIGFLSGVVAKGIIQAIMIIYFLVVVL